MPLLLIAVLFVILASVLVLRMLGRRE